MKLNTHMYITKIQEDLYINNEKRKIVIHQIHIPTWNCQRNLNAKNVENENEARNETSR